MATAMLKCRVCGKEYKACRNARRVDGVFRWQDVACSPEHGATYLNLIRESRAETHDTVANDTDNKAYALFDEEYSDESDEEMFYDESDDAEEPEIEV